MPNPDELVFRDAVEPWRRELLAHCYRMCGSLSEADDLVPVVRDAPGLRVGLG